MRNSEYRARHSITIILLVMLIIACNAVFMSNLHKPDTLVQAPTQTKSINLLQSLRI